MQANKWVRQQMLLDLRDQIQGTADFIANSKGSVEFFRTDGTKICELEFKDTIIQTTSTDNAILRFQSTDNTYTLKGTASESGTVTAFKINGINSDTPTEGYVIVGTVGSLASSADITFNMTSWSDGTYVTIENFEIIMPNGS